MNPNFGQSGLTGCIVSVLVAHIWLQLVCYGQNTNTTTDVNIGNDTDHDIDFETLSLFGVSHQFAEEFRANLLKAIEAAKEEIDPLRQQAEFEEEEEEDDTSPPPPGPGAFGVLSGLFGIFSGLGSFNPSRIVQSTVNFFPPAQRMQAQIIVDSLIGFNPAANRTRNRTRRPLTSTPMTISEMMMKEVTENSTAVKDNETDVAPMDAENMGGVNASSPSSMDIVTPEPTTTAGLINVHELLNRTTTAAPLQNEDDENDFDKKTVYTTVKPKSNSSMAIYKLVAKTPGENTIGTRGVAEEEIVATKMILSNETLTSTTAATLEVEAVNATSSSASTMAVETLNVTLHSTTTVEIDVLNATSPSPSSSSTVPI